MSRGFWLSILVLLLGSGAGAQGLEIGPNHSGLALGNVPEFTGLRLNFRDRNLYRVDGVNFTIGPAHGTPTGRVSGVSISLWAPAAEELHGFAIGLLGVQAESRLRGVGIGLLGVGAGESATGLTLGGLGMGVGEDLSGLAIGGLGAGVGRDFRGIGIAGLGMGVGENVDGLLVAGLGAGVGGDFRGIGASLLGFGVGEDATALLASGLGFGVGGDFRGVAVAGLGMGVGGRLEGIAVGGLGLGMGESHGFTAATAMVRGQEMHGVTVSAYNDFERSMEGLAIGVVNITEVLHGVQLGLINIAWDNPRGRRVLPFINWGS